MEFNDINWEIEEDILCLDLYLNRDYKDKDEIIKLVEILNELNFPKTDLKDFRDVDSVKLKLLNFQNLDNNINDSNILDKNIWDFFNDKKDYLSKISNAIKKSQKDLNKIRREESFDAVFIEGKTLYKMHRIKEKNNKLIERKKEEAIKNNNLSCEICGFNFEKTYGKIGRNFIEFHNTKPISYYGDENSSNYNEKIVLVCSNCHSMLHRQMFNIGIKELKNIVKENKI